MEDSFLTALTNTGVAPGMSDDVRKRTRFCNKISMVLIVLDLISAPVLYVFAPAVCYLALVSLLLSVSVIVLNYLLRYKAACFIMANSLSIVAAMLNASVMQEYDAPIFSIYAIQVSLLLLPFLIYTGSEKSSLYTSLVFSSALVMSTPLLNNVFRISMDSTLFTSGFMAYQFTLIGVIILVFCAEVYRRETNSIMLSNLKLIEALKETSIENTDHKWHTEGLFLISEILRRENNDMKQMARNTLTGVVEYLQSLQGTFYILTDADKDVLELCATYASTKAKEQILVGEGLVGQAMLDKVTICLEQVSGDFSPIGSSLGNALPASVMVTPLLYGNKAIGVIELSSFQRYTQRDILFMEELGKAVAISVMNVQYNEQNHSLVKQLQEQTEELKVREEELTANIEELNRLQQENDGIREKASRRIREQIESQRVLMDKTINRFKEREAELEQKLAEAGIK
jgi:GAF domain-containing protein